MKKIIFAISMIVFATLAVAAQALPTLSGDEAIENLKQNGQYDSLMDAVSAARRENGQTANLATENAIGQTAKLLASPNDAFGVTVAISGDTAIVGASNDPAPNLAQGSAYVFVRSGTTWARQQILTASDGALGDRFGSNVAISGETILVAAASDDVGTNEFQGSVYVFTRSASMWTEQQRLNAADGGDGDIFGSSLAMTGDTAIIGASSDDVTFSNQGSAYVFVRSGATWTQQQKLTTADGRESNFFGNSAAISGDTIVVGAPRHAVGENSEQGAAYVFVRSGTTWTQQQKLTASDGVGLDRLGNSVAISDDTIIVGASNVDVGGNLDWGAVYVFVRSGATWTQQQKFTSTDGAAFSNFGSRVVISGDVAIIASSGNLSIYVFIRSGTTWTLKQKLTSEESGNSSSFSSGIAISGSNIIIGAASAAYVFRFLSNNWIQESQRSAVNGAAGDNFGTSVAISGNVAIVGAPHDDIDADLDRGTAYIFVYSAAGWTQQVQLTGSSAGDNFGASVAISGSLVIIGVPGRDVGTNLDQGAASVFECGILGCFSRAFLAAGDGAANDNFGASVGIANTGVNFAIIGAPGKDVGANADQGAVYLFNDDSFWHQVQKITATDGAAGDGFGGRVVMSPNVTTLLIGADRANGNQGAAYIFQQSGSEWLQLQKLTAGDGAAGDRFGSGISLSGDTVLIGAYLDTIGANNQQGSAYVFIRSGTTWNEQQKLTAADGAGGDAFGSSVSISAETVVIGASLDDVGANVDQGSAYVFQRSGGIWVQIQKLTSADGAAGDSFGAGVSIRGDKIVVGVPLADTPAADQGKALFFIDFIAPVLNTTNRNLFDFDGDGKTDLSIFRPATGEWWINRSSTAQTGVAQFGNGTDKIVPADYTGDRKTDIAFWRPSTGEWFILRSEDGSYYSIPFGTSDDILVPADFDGDGKADIAVFRPSTNVWYILKSSGGIDIIQFGASGDKPVVGDYDGDGKADIAIFRPNAAEWWIRRSSTGATFALQFGNSGDRPTPGDFTGDGKTDIAVWRPLNGVWYILRSEDSSYYALPFGITNDIPATGDYDGDGRFDVAVFRPSTSTWYVQGSTSGQLIQQYGIGNDIPTPSAFVP